MKHILLPIFLLLAQTLYAQNTALSHSENIDAALIATIMKGKTDTVATIFKWVAENISYDKNI